MSYYDVSLENEPIEDLYLAERLYESNTDDEYLSSECDFIESDYNFEKFEYESQPEFAFEESATNHEPEKVEIVPENQISRFGIFLQKLKFYITYSILSA